MIKNLTSLCAVAGLTLAFSGTILAVENQPAKVEVPLHQSMPAGVSSSAPLEKPVESSTYSDIDPITTGSHSQVF